MHTDEELDTIIHILEKLIAREQRFLEDAYKRRDVDDHRHHASKQNAFLELLMYFEPSSDKTITNKL